MTHHDRDAILARFREADRFVIDLAHGDTAWDPETGDSLLGPARITFARGGFPGPALTAAIDRLAALAPSPAAGLDAFVTIVATVRVLARGTEAATAEAVDRLRSAVLDTLADQGAELVPCDWAPDGDTITDAIGQERPVTVLDLNPGR